MSSTPAPRRELAGTLSLSLVSADALESPAAIAARHRARGIAEVPRRIGRYEIGERLGAGGMGEVFSAYDPTLGRSLAIKLVHAELLTGLVADEAVPATMRLFREAQTLARVNHPHVVQVYEVGTLGTSVYLALEVVRGPTLRQWSERRPGLAPALDVLVQVAQGLHAIHRVGLVHRDVKPDNVIVADDGRTRVVDFGLARTCVLGTPSPGGSEAPAGAHEAERSLPSPSTPLPARLTATGAVVGTPVYMAPEQLRRQVIDPRCDQFAFCVMAWELLLGERPFASGNLHTLFQAHRAGARPPANCTVPPEIVRVLQRGLSYEPSARWPDMDALVQALTQARTRPRTRLRIAAVALPTAMLAAVTLARLDLGASPCERLGPDGERAHARARTLAGAAIAAPQRTQLQARAHALADQRAAVCEQARADPQQGRAATAACLDRALARIDATATALASDGESTAQLDALTWLDRDAARGCDEANAADLPLDPRTATEVARVRTALDQARAELALGRLAALAEREPGLSAMAIATGFAPLQAEAAAFAGELASAQGDPTRARALLLGAADQAEAAGLDAFAAELWLTLARVSIAELADASLAEHDLRRAQASVARLPEDATLREGVQLRRAQLSRLRGDLEGAHTQLQPLLAALGDATVPPHAWPVLEVAIDVAQARGAIDEARGWARRERDAVVAALGPDHVALARLDYNLGMLELRHGDADAALGALERARVRWQRSLGPRHPDLALVHTALQQWHLQHGTLASARAHADLVVELRRDQLPPDHPDLALAWLGQGAMALLQDDVESAVAAYTRALAIEQQTLGSEHPETALVAVDLAEARLARGDDVLAELEPAIAQLERTPELDPQVLAFAGRVHAAALRRAGRSDDAARALARAL
ncbi:MAG: serine/threonine-protein kinase, partial [Nannocystaceae bacterium]|nr:serine/threonine-protein kinase [Nannocystaceae bacterium]